jgi:hypothetical protein
MKKNKKRIWSIVALLLLLIAVNRYEHIQHHKLADSLQEQPESIVIVYSDYSETRIFEARNPRHIGWAGETPLQIAFSNDGKIISVSFLPNNETPGFIRRIENSGFMDSWNGLTAGEAINKRVDAISGATMTTQSVINTLRDDLIERVKAGEIESENEISQLSKGWYRYVKISASLLILVVALFSFFFPKKMSPFRLYLLALSVIVFGFWQGQYLSVTHFINMAMYGFNWTVWFIPLLVITAFALPLIFRKSFYCTYVCPFGAAQELVSKLNKKHIKIPQKVYNILIYLRPLYLLVIIGLLFTGILSDFANFEPFVAFMLNVNLWIPMVIAGVFLLVSIFCPKFWCKYCCPTGYVISLVE